MITQKQAERIAENYCDDNDGNSLVYHAVLYGIQRAKSEYTPDIMLLRRENETLRLEKALIIEGRDNALAELARLKNSTANKNEHE